MVEPAENVAELVEPTVKAPLLSGSAPRITPGLENVPAAETDTVAVPLLPRMGAKLLATHEEPAPLTLMVPLAAALAPATMGPLVVSRPPEKMLTTPLPANPIVAAPLQLNVPPVVIVA